MALVLYGTLVATSVVTSIGAQVVTRLPKAAKSLATQTGVSYFSSTQKNSYAYYYKRMVSEGPLYDTIINILAAFADKGYGVMQDPRTFPNGEKQDICADVICFRNTTSFYDYSSFGCMRVRIFYENGQAVMMCQKKWQLEHFVNKFNDSSAKEPFDMSKLTFIGIG
jgi:hypothetical protein